MGDSPDGPLAKPGEDPYEIAWPDDAQEQRAAERAARAKRESVKPAPLLLAAASAGIGVVLLFMVPIALVSGVPALAVNAALPIVVAALVVGLPTYLALNWATKSMPTGFAEVAFLVVGGAMGYGLTYVFVTWLSEPGEQIDASRSLASIFMLTAVASGFMVARMSAERFRYLPRAVWGAAAIIVALTALSFFSNFFLYPVA